MPYLFSGKKQESYTRSIVVIYSGCRFFRDVFLLCRSPIWQYSVYTFRGILINSFYFLTGWNICSFKKVLSPLIPHEMQKPSGIESKSDMERISHEISRRTWNYRRTALPCIDISDFHEIFPISSHLAVCSCDVEHIQQPLSDHTRSCSVAEAFLGFDGSVVCDHLCQWGCILVYRLYDPAFSIAQMTVTAGSRGA